MSSRNGRQKDSSREPLVQDNKTHYNSLEAQASFMHDLQDIVFEAQVHGSLNYKDYRVELVL